MGYISTISRPISNVNSLWSTYDFDYINDDILNPASGDNECIIAAKVDDNFTQSYNMAVNNIPPYVHIVDKIIVNILAFKVASPPNLIVNITVNGKNKVSQSVALTTSPAWYQIIFNGQWNRSELIKGIILSFTTGIMATNDTINIDVAYCELKGNPKPYII